VIVLCIDILYRLVILKIKHDVFIRIESLHFVDTDFRRFGLRSDVIVNQNRDLLYNPNLRIVINFNRNQAVIIRCNRNYTEFSQLKRTAKMPYFQGFSGIGENQGMENYTELHNYTFGRCFYAVLNMKMIIIINLTPLGQ